MKKNTVKKAVLLSFRLNDMGLIKGGPTGIEANSDSVWWDKVPSKFEGWGENRFRDAGFRAVPNCVVRHSAHIAKNVVLMLGVKRDWSKPDNNQGNQFGNIDA